MERSAAQLRARIYTGATVVSAPAQQQQPQPQQDPHVLESDTTTAKRVKSRAGQAASQAVSAAQEERRIALSDGRAVVVRKGAAPKPVSLAQLRELLPEEEAARVWQSLHAEPEAEADTAVLLTGAPSAASGVAVGGPGGGGVHSSGAPISTTGRLISR